jgi:predicted DNA-binding protein (MmcQ/YjbR family)
MSSVGACSVDMRASCHPVVGRVATARRSSCSPWETCDGDARHLSLKLPAEDAVATVASDPDVEAAGYGLGRHGWVALTLEGRVDEERWRQVEEWVRTSYTLVAPRRLARVVLAEDAAASARRE